MIARIIVHAMLACVLFTASNARAQGVKIMKEFKGEAKADALEKTVGGTNYFQTADTFKKFWAATGSKTPLPKVDFAKQFVLRAYAREAKDLEMQLTLNAKGDLAVGQTSKEGTNAEVMSYHVVIINREGIKTIGGRKIKN